MHTDSHITQKLIQNCTQTPFITKLVQYAAFFANISLQRCLKLCNLKLQRLLLSSPLAFLLQIECTTDQLLIRFLQYLTFTLEFSNAMFSLKTSHYS